MIRSMLFAKRLILLTIFSFAIIILAYHTIFDSLKQEHLEQRRNDFLKILQILEDYPNALDSIQLLDSKISPKTTDESHYQIYTATNRLISEPKDARILTNFPSLPDSNLNQLYNQQEPFHHFLRNDSGTYLQIAAKLSDGRVLVLTQSTEGLLLRARLLMVDLTFKSGLIALALLIPALYLKRRAKLQGEAIKTDLVSPENPNTSLWEIWNQIGIDFKDNSEDLPMQSSKEEATAEDVQALYEKGHQWFMRRNLLRAKENLLMATKLGFDHFSTWYLLGIIFAREGAISTATNAFNQASKIIPNHPKCLYKLGLLYGKSSQQDKLAIIYTRLESSSPELTQRLKKFFENIEPLASISPAHLIRLHEKY